MASFWTVSTFAAIAIAQSTTLTIPFYGYDQYQSIVASVVAVSGSVTTLSLACAPGTDGSDCGLAPEQVLTVGPSTWNMYMAVPGGEFVGTQDCSTAASSAVCSESAGGFGANDPGSTTNEYDADAIVTLPVVITAGASKLGNVEASATGESGASATTTTPTTGSGAAAMTASVTQLTGTATPSESNESSSTGSAPAANSSGAASANMVSLGGAGIVAGVLGGLLM